jgi:hypothetical protein
MTLAGWIRRCASLLTMRRISRISRIDQRIRSDLFSEGEAAFFLTGVRLA